MKIRLFVAAFAAFILYGASEAKAQVIRGVVYGMHNDDGVLNKEPLPFASVYWIDQTSGVTADEKGKFIISVPASLQARSPKLIASFVGFIADTLTIGPGVNKADFVLNAGTELTEVEISDKTDGNYISKIKPIKTEVISESGLQKLACCNLSESFEGTATVDVGYADAVSGARRIQMLGLSGIYSQLMMESIPVMRGLAVPYGLSYIPGPWMQSIQISKGTSAVINGYESITGQINVEYKKPEHFQSPFYLNLYGNSDGRGEANILSSVKINENWSTLLMAHGALNPVKIDHNGDTFLDIPIGWTANFMNRWSYEKEGKMHAQFGINYIQDDKNGGQIAYYSATGEQKPAFYSTHVNSRQYGAFLKTGFFLGGSHYKSLGMMASFTRNEIASVFGRNDYHGGQNSGYLNVIYQSIFGNTNHKFSLGGGLTYDETREMLNDSLFPLTEWVPGAFFQYTYTVPEKFNLILGLRGDYNSVYGFLATPRVHAKWDITDLLIVRASAGRGFRSPHVLAENLNVLASSRLIITNGPFKMEEAWNYGLNITKEFLLSERRRASFGIDFYRTDFVNQIVVDFDYSPQTVLFYNLDGKSYSNSLQADFMIQPIDGMEITLAGRYNNVKKTISHQLRESPYVNKFKTILTISYATWKEKWKFDLTAQYNGISRIPSTGSNPQEYQRPQRSEPYFMLHAQITKKFKIWEIYVGGENLTNFTQHHPIIASDDPFGRYFDASMIWGPVMGRTFYAGIRLTLKSVSKNKNHS